MMIVYVYECRPQLMILRSRVRHQPPLAQEREKNVWATESKKFCKIDPSWSARVPHDKQRWDENFNFVKKNSFS